MWQLYGENELEFGEAGDNCKVIKETHTLGCQEKMEFSMFFILSNTLLLLSSSAFGKTVSPPAPTPTPTPAPAPAPDYVNLTELLTVAGPFHTFLNYLESTKVLDTFQNQANNTEEGITIFVPKDSNFASKKKTLSNLTQEQLKQVILFHALPHFYSLAEFKNLSETSTPTFAGGDYTLNFTDDSGTVLINSGWAKTKVTSAVHATDPVAVYEVDKVLLPEAIFGTDIPPTPAPAPAPAVAPAADSPTEHSADSKASSPSSSQPDGSSAAKTIISHGGSLVLATFGVVMMLL
ncbi:hypothetical protein Ahy_A07g031026 [Arachis hypogaea]|uniref:FAS1 domain-containing protein n=2 Tax=Arachis TaxID=3817 RepID=A0A445C2N1_ARAHY|nr:hypothetical protein Ahy_A07g031026 [Arachis hypogaea]